MKKILLFLSLSCFLISCEKQETKLLNSLKTFESFHRDVCHCMLNSMPNFVRTLNSDGYNNKNYFCYWHAHICSNQKTDEEIIASAKIMDKFGGFKCNDEYFTNKFMKASRNENVNTMCNTMWSNDSVVYLGKIAHLTNTCEETFGKTQKVNCLCVVKSYIPTLSQEELTELDAYGQLYPGYGWKTNTKKKQAITTSIMGKMRDSVLKCTK